MSSRRSLSITYILIPNFCFPFQISDFVRRSRVVLQNEQVCCCCGCDVSSRRSLSKTRQLSVVCCELKGEIFFGRIISMNVQLKRVHLVLYMWAPNVFIIWQRNFNVVKQTSTTFVRLKGRMMCIENILILPKESVVHYVRSSSWQRINFSKTKTKPARNKEWINESSNHPINQHQSSIIRRYLMYQKCQNLYHKCNRIKIYIRRVIIASHLRVASIKQLSSSVQLQYVKSHSLFPLSITWLQYRLP